MTQPIKVLVASSNTNFLAVLCWSLAHDDRLEVVGQAADGDAVVACPVSFDIALLDVAVHGLGVLGVISQLQRRVPPPATVVITHTDAVYLRHAVAAEGAADYLVMPGDLDELPDRLVLVSRSATPSLVPN